jgi:hypothetical protein
LTTNCKGFTDICLCLDQTTEQLYAVWFDGIQKRISHINMSDLSVLQTWDLSTSDIGYVFVDNGLVYICDNHGVGKIERCYKLESSEWDNNFTPITLSHDGYTTQVTYDRQTSTLIQSDYSHGIFI